MRNLIIVAAGAVALVLPQAALAEVDIRTDFATRSIAVLEDSPERDLVSLTARPDLGFVIEDSAGIGSVDSPCSRLSSTSARCPVLDTTELFFNLAERRDRVVAELPAERAFFLTEYIYRLGAGNDRFFGAQVAERVSSGIGDDRLAGGAGDDSLNGGTDDDELDGGDGSDSCNGGPGRDEAGSCESERRIP